MPPRPGRAARYCSWALFPGLLGQPGAALCLIRGANSDVLSRDTADGMARRRPDMIRVDLPGRGHVPFLDEPPALDAIRRWIAALRAPVSAGPDVPAAAP